MAVFFPPPAEFASLFEEDSDELIQFVCWVIERNWSVWEFVG